MKATGGLVGVTNSVAFVLRQLRSPARRHERVSRCLAVIAAILVFRAAKRSVIGLGRYRRAGSSKSSMRACCADTLHALSTRRAGGVASAERPEQGGATTVSFMAVSGFCSTRKPVMPPRGLINILGKDRPRALSRRYLRQGAAYSPEETGQPRHNHPIGHTLGRAFRRARKKSLSCHHSLPVVTERPSLPRRGDPQSKRPTIRKTFSVIATAPAAVSM